MVINTINFVTSFNTDAINAMDAIHRNYLNTYTPLRSDMDHCKRLKEERYSCLIGKSMLSRGGEFYKMLVSRANAEKLVILSFTDYAYVELAINLHESLQALHITNFLFICADVKALNVLKRRGISSFLYQHPQISSNNEPSFYSDDFIVKTSIKIKIITAALMMGFQVLFTDADVVFLRNPIPHLTSYNDVDLVIQNDTDSGLNSSFLMARPTYSGITLMMHTILIVMTRMIDDQTALNRVIKKMVSANSLAMVVLDTEQFPCGRVYFEDEKRMFLEDRSKNDVAYIVHINFLHTKVTLNIKYSILSVLDCIL